MKNGKLLEIDGLTVEMNFVGAEWEEYHALYVFWELDVSDSLKEISIFNDVFLEVSSEQQNMHYLQIGDKKKNLLLQKGKTKSSIKF